MGGRDRRAEPRGGVTPRLGVPKGVCPLRGDSTRGLGPLVRVGEAGSRAEPAREGGILEQDVDRLSGEPACPDAGPSASRCVATALARSSALCMIVARRKIPHWILTSVSAIAAEVFMNNAG